MKDELKKPFQRMVPARAWMAERASRDRTDFMMAYEREGMPSRTREVGTDAIYALRWWRSRVTASKRIHCPGETLPACDNLPRSKRPVEG